MMMMMMMMDEHGDVFLLFAGIYLDTYLPTCIHTYLPTYSLDQDQMARDLDAAVEEMVKEGWDEEVARNVGR